MTVERQTIYTSDILVYFMVKPKKEVKRNNHGTRKCKLNKPIAEIVVMPDKPNKQ